jgi:hypothetical protein
MCFVSFDRKLAPLHKIGESFVYTCILASSLIAGKTHIGAGTCVQNLREDYNGLNLPLGKKTVIENLRFFIEVLRQA